MSSSIVYDIDEAIFDLVMQEGAKRFLSHWDTLRWNLWKTYNSVQDEDWWDPWFENDAEGIYNGPATEESPFAYEQLTNAFGIWNWHCFKGYSEIASVSLLTAHTLESTVSGGLWQAGLIPYTPRAPYNYCSGSYRGLIGYTASAIYSGSNPNAVWYNRGSRIPGYTVAGVDPYDGQTYSVTARENSYDAIMRYQRLKKYVETIGGQIYIRIEQPPKFDPNSADPITPQHYFGYGLVQWTPWTELVITAGDMSEAMFGERSWGAQNWQLNLTLQLMVLEYERSLAMSTPSSQQTGSDYRGQWVNENAPRASAVYDGYYRYYPRSECTWDEWADGRAVGYMVQYMAEQHHYVMDDWDKIQISMDLFRVCYLHTGPSPSYTEAFRKRSAYFLAAERYWRTHGGQNPKYIPRARDLPSTELDKFHITPGAALAFGTRRVNNGIRSVLF